MSRTFSTKSGSGLSLKVSTRWGLSPKARQIRDTADWLIPVALAIDRVDQWVASTGVSSRVFDDETIDVVVVDRARRSGPGLVVKALEALEQEPAAPLAHGQIWA